MHIAWISKKSPFCGNVTYSIEITRGLIERGHRVSFIHFHDENAPAIANPDIFPAWEREISLPYIYKSQILTIQTPKAAQILSDALEDLEPDVVHASLSLSPLDFSIPDICNALNIPSISTFHPAFDRHHSNFASRAQHLIYKMYAPALGKYHRTIIFSDLQKQYLMNMGVPAERLTVIPNGVDAQVYSPGPSQIKERLGAERLFVYQGRLSPEKNIESLLKVWKQCVAVEKTIHSGSKLVIVGDGPLASSLQAQYRREHGVEWLGYISNRSERIEILRGADVCILPSLIEGLSLSMLEAMACGTAMVATDVGADGEVLNEGAGIAISAERVTGELVTLLPLLQDQREFTQLLGVKARQRVLERYTLRQNLNRVDGLYSEVVEPVSVVGEPQRV